MIRRRYQVVCRRELAATVVAGRGFVAGVRGPPFAAARSPNPQLRVEAHLIDYTGDLYGQELEVAFVERLRGEQQFASLGDLPRG